MPSQRPGPHPRRMAALVGVAALCVTGLLSGSVPAAAGPDSRLSVALQQAPADLRTPFERSDGAAWTTVDEGEQFWADLDASTRRVAVDRIGTTPQGRPLQLVQVGHPEPDPRARAADGSVLMYNCSIHGDEPSGREACMQLARDMAASDHPAVTRMLRQTTVLFLNSNPDGWAAGTRQNAQGFDVNRDFMALQTTEGQAIATTIRDWRPDVLNDLHEYGPREFYEFDLLHLWPRNRNVDPAVYRRAKQMNDDYSRPLVESLGHSASVYGELVKNGEPFLQVAGDGQARILRNYSGLQHVVGMLSETADAPLTAEEEADPALLNRRRVEVNYTSAVGSAQMIAENRRQLERQTARAETRATQQGAAQSGVVYFAGQDNMLPTSSDEVEPSPMCGYQLNAAQLSTLEDTLRGHGIGWQENAAGALVPMAQPDRPLVPLLLDGRSEYRVTEAVPVDHC